MKAVALDAVTRSYTANSEVIKALDGVSITVEKGAVVAVVGPSGSGKTTLLNLIGGLDFPTEGTVKVNGVATSELRGGDLQRFRNQTVGVIFQQFFLVDHLTVFENVMVPLIPRSLSAVEKKEKVLRVLDRVGLPTKIDRLPSELSGGELQRVAIARGIVGEPSVVLADEPTGNLDLRTGSEIIKLLATESRENQKTVIIATHDLRLLE